MGKNSTPTNSDTMSSTRNLAVLFAIMTMTTVLPQAGAKQGATAVHKTAQTYISEFRQGEDFNQNDSVTGIVVNKKVAPSTLKLLRAELAIGTSAVRMNLIRLLEKIGIELDTPAADKFAVIRDHAIIGALVTEGFAKGDAAAEAAATVLSNRTKPSDLAAYNDIYAKSLQSLKGQYLILATKAKTTQALPFVEQMARLPEWQDEPSRRDTIKIAQAALGNNVVEDEFIKAVKDAELRAPQAPPNRFYNVGSAKDGTKVAKGLSALGLIGTRRALLTVCDYLRSPLKSYVPQVRERSVRYAALDALLYNFPDERVLDAPIDLAGWNAAERFCSKNLGAVFDGPTPDIPPDQAYPSMVLPRPARK